MSKYIDADLLRQEIERRKKGNMYDELPMTIGRYYEDRDLLAFIDSLQQEQPVDLDADIEMEWDSFNKHLAEYGEEAEEVVWLNYNSFKELAQLFFNTGILSK